MRLRKLFASRRRSAPLMVSARSILIAETLEPRTLLNATQISALNPVQLAPGTSSTPINLSLNFDDPLITGQAAVIDTTQGLIPLNLFTQQAPLTVANFEQYATNNEYNETVIQRAVPGFILQGGGFLDDQSHIPTIAPVPNEFSLSNTLGTIAAALNTDPVTQQFDPNSATSDWFINDGNNTSLDAQKFTVFGQVIYDGMTVVNQIEALPKGSVAPGFTPNVNAGDPAGGVLPLQDYNSGSPILTTNYVLTNSVEIVNPLLFTASSDNTSIVSTSVNGTNLTLTAGSGNGTANITVTAGDLGGNDIQATFAVQVGQTQAILGKGATKVVHFTDPDGASSQITMSGPGTATVSFGGVGLTTSGKGSAETVSGTPQDITIAMTGSTAASSLTITGKGGNGSVNIASITADGSMRSINGRNTVIGTNITTAGSVGTIALGRLNNAIVTLGAGVPANVSVGSITNGSIFAEGAIKSVLVNSWATGGTISGTAVGRVVVKSAFPGIINAASVQSFTAASISGASWTISGNVGSLTAKSISDWNAAVGTLGKLTVSGAFDSSALLATGNLSTVTVGSLTNSKIFAGIASTDLPTQTDDFAANANIKSVKVKTFVNSSVAAYLLTTINLGAAQTGNNGSPFGVAAHQIKSLTATVGGKPLKLSNITTAAQVTAAYTAAGITATDPRVNII